ncbi:MAG: hypothetical protein JWR32_5609 [Mycobacterium sp.]|jgi:hypothetical protein|nr:hypothetical protein [Mycobacterium sp.]
MNPPPRQLLLVDILLEDGRVAAAELRRTAGQQPSTIEEQPLPAARPVRDVGRRTGPLDRLGLAGQVFVQEVHEFGPVRLDVVVESELHGTPCPEKVETPVCLVLR